MVDHEAVQPVAAKFCCGNLAGIMHFSQQFVADVANYFAAAADFFNAALAGATADAVFNAARA